MAPVPVELKLPIFVALATQERHPKGQRRHLLQRREPPSGFGTLLSTETAKTASASPQRSVSQRPHFSLHATGSPIPSLLNNRFTTADARIRLNRLYPQIAN
ncbi:hypothetical protein [Nostoc sp. CALU 1950]|uniref:hypothetical protein n=1 Tax=Nostoc sp. CALU 1950 TaxID=3104321 RepID=UPI003EB9578D